MHFLGDYEMTEIQEKQKEIEEKIDEWKKEGRIRDASKRHLHNGSTLCIRIQYSGKPLSVFFNGQACKVRLEDSNEPPRKFTWGRVDVVEKVLRYIDQLLKS